jgi:ATP/maltotriose-dependent transcriptional regulator MalT
VAGASRIVSRAASPAQPLPTSGTPFIGRDADLHKLDALLNAPACRLLTIVGPGGMGKTRLALEAVGRAVAQGAGMATFVPLAAARTLDDSWLLARSLAVMTTALADHGELDRAAETGAESLARVRLLRDGQAPIYLLNVLGQLATARNEHAHALALLTEALERARRESHGREGEAWTLRNLGLARHLQGDLDGATADFRASLAMRHAAGQSVGVAWALEGLAGVAVSAGDWARAARLWGAAARLRRAGDSSMSPADQSRFDRWSAQVRLAMGADAFTAAWAQGAEWDEDTAVSYAMTDARV